MTDSRIIDVTTIHWGKNLFEDLYLDEVKTLLKPLATSQNNSPQ
jgi:hypothetical protein